MAVRQYPSKKYCSPIKTGEYLACGLPVIIPEGISDDYQEMEEKGIAITMKGNDSFIETAIKVKSYLQINDLQKIRNQAQDYALRNRNVEDYKELYSELF